MKVAPVPGCLGCPGRLSGCLEAVLLGPRLYPTAAASGCESKRVSAALPRRWRSVPKRFPDRESVRRLVRGEEFAAWIAVVPQGVIGGVGVPAASRRRPEAGLERARVAAHARLGDLERLAPVAADPEARPPIAFTAAEGGRGVRSWPSRT